MFGHLYQQGSVITSTLGLLVARKGQGLPELPGPVVSATVAPRPPWLIDNYLRVVGGDPKAWSGQLPPHMFAQWCWPFLTRTLHGLPYDLTKVVNAGCRWTSHAPLPSDAPLEISARLMKVDDDGRRALIEAELVTGTAGNPRALVATMVVYCPVGQRESSGKREGGGKSAAPTVPLDVTVLGERELAGNLGWRFALVTGDFNPIHWIAPYGKAAGFGGVILHGFATAAIAAESAIANRYAGDVRRVTGMEARFTRPLRLPATVQVCLGAPTPDSTPLFVGTAPGGPAFLVGALHG